MPDGRVVVTYLYRGGPAALAGLAPGDVIQSIAGTPVTSHAEFTRLSRELRPESGVDVVIRRDGSPQTMPLLPRDAAEVFDRACDLGDAEACSSFGSMLADGDGVARDATLARDILRRACDGESYSGCIKLGNLFRRGQGGEREPEEGVRLFVRACDAGIPTGCFNAGVMYGNGLDLPRDTVLAHRYFETACRMGDEEACTEARRRTE